VGEGLVDEIHSSSWLHAIGYLKSGGSSSVGQLPGVRRPLNVQSSNGQSPPSRLEHTREVSVRRFETGANDPLHFLI